MRRYALLALVLLLAAAASGCYSRVRNTGFLEAGYEDTHPVDTRYLKLNLAGEAFATSAMIEPGDAKELGLPIPVVAPDDGYTTRGIVFIVPEPEWIAPDAFHGDEEKYDQLLFTLRERMYRYLLRAYPHPVRARYAFRQSDPIIQDYRVITITSNITHYRKGVGIARYLVGYGLGQTYIQVEGEIFEGPNRERKIGEYAIRRGNGGYAQNGLNPAVLRDHYTMLYALDEAVMELTKRLPAYIPGVELIPEPGAESGSVALSPASSRPNP